MPFEYTPYRSPYAGAIADLIGRQGDIAAERALADAKARTATVGAITNSLANIAQYRADAPKRELQQMQLAEARQRMADAAEARTAGSTLGQLVSNPEYRDGFQPQGATPEGDLLPKGPSLVADMGNGLKLLDKNAIAQQMAQAGHGDWFLKNSNLIDDLNKSSQEMHGYKQQQLQRMATLYLRLPETFSNETRIASAQALLDANGDALPPAEREALQKAIGVGDLQGIDAMASRMLPVATPQRINVARGGKNVAVDPLTGRPIAGTEISGEPTPLTETERKEKLGAAYVAVQNGTADSDQIALVKANDALIAASRVAPKETVEEKSIRLESMRLQGVPLSNSEAAWLSAYNAKKENEQGSGRYQVIRTRDGLQLLNTKTAKVVKAIGSDGKPLQLGIPLSPTESRTVDIAKTLILQEGSFIKQLNDPAFVKKLGPALGRLSNISSDVGDADPEIARFIGRVKSFAQANNTIHGARDKSAREAVADLLSVKHTPESLKAALQGITEFSHDYLKVTTGMDEDEGDNETVDF